MKEIKIEYRDSNIKFGIKNYKFILSSNYDEVYDIKKSIINYFAKTKHSEYDFEKNQSHNILIDCKLINLRESKLYIVNKEFDLKQDIKLGTKSLLLKYIESKLSKIEYDDNLIMINNILGIISEEYLNDSNTITQEVSLKLIFEEINLKIISKLIETNVVKELFSYNPEEITLKENILTQLKLLICILEHSSGNDIVLIELDYIDNEIYNEIKKIENSNIIIFTEELNVTTDINSIFILNKNKYDLACENTICNEVMMNLPYHIDIEELREKIVNEIIVNRDKIKEFFK